MLWELLMPLSMPVIEKGTSAVYSDAQREMKQGFSKSKGEMFVQNYSIYQLKQVEKEHPFILGIRK